MSTYNDDVTFHHVDVVFAQAGGGFEVLAPCKDHKVDGAKRGHVIEWHFHNRGEANIDAAIGNLRAPVRFKDDKGREETPFDKSCALKAPPVSKGSSQKVSCQVRADAIVNQTYKYDILANGKVLLDPEIEIEP